MGGGRGSLKVGTGGVGLVVESLDFGLIPDRGIGPGLRFGLITGGAILAGLASFTSESSSMVLPVLALLTLLLAAFPFASPPSSDTPTF